MIKTLILKVLMTSPNPELLLSICNVETKLRNVINYNDGRSHSYGLCQIKLNTARLFDKRATVKKLMNIEYNIKIASKYLEWQLKRYANDTVKAVSAYNAGKFKLSNNKYVQKVFKERVNFSRELFYLNLVKGI